MAVKIKTGESPRGDVVETHEAGNYVFVDDQGHLLVSTEATTNTSSVIAIYAPGKWRSVTVERAPKR